MCSALLAAVGAQEGIVGKFKIHQISGGGGGFLPHPVPGTQLRLLEASNFQLPHLEACAFFDSRLDRDKFKAIVGSRRGFVVRAVSPEPFFFRAWGVNRQTMCEIAFTPMDGEGGIIKVFQAHGYTPISEEDLMNQFGLHPTQVHCIRCNCKMWVDGFEDMMCIDCSCTPTPEQNAAAGGAVFPRGDHVDPNARELPPQHSLLATFGEDEFAKCAKLVGPAVQKLASWNRLLISPQGTPCRAEVDRIDWIMDNSAAGKVLGTKGCSAHWARSLWGPHLTLAGAGHMLYQVPPFSFFWRRPYSTQSLTRAFAASILCGRLVGRVLRMS